MVPQGEIALFVAADGDSIPAERILGKVADGVTRGLKALWRWKSEGYVIKK